MTSIVAESQIQYSITDDKDIFALIKTVRDGISYGLFSKIVKSSPFDLKEWSNFLHLSERTLQRYKKEKKNFEPIHTEKILKITLLHKKGQDVFGSPDKFNTWLDSENLAFAGLKPKSFLDNSFGINFIQDELGRIEHGILA